MVCTRREARRSLPRCAQFLTCHQRPDAKTHATARQAQTEIALTYNVEHNTITQPLRALSAAGSQFVIQGGLQCFEPLCATFLASTCRSYWQQWEAAQHPLNSPPLHPTKARWGVSALCFGAPLPSTATSMSCVN